jgi:rubrerythrin
MPNPLTRILREAISIEEESFTLYSTAQEKARSTSSKSFLKELAETELGHKRRLMEVVNKKALIQSLGSHKGELLEDLKVVDYMKDITKLSDDADYQEILTYAAQREKRTHDYYVSLTKMFQGTQISNLFQRLAEEELKHKIKLEKEYDDILLKGN